MVKKKDFMLFLGAATILMIVFSTMFLAAKVRRGVEVRTSEASSNFAN